MFEQLKHPNVISCHPGKGLDGKNVVVIFTSLPTDPNHASFDENAYKSLQAAVQSYLDRHDEYDRATLVPK